MVTVKKLYDFLNSIAPFDLIEEYDNVGLIVGDNKQIVEKAMVTLDVTTEVIAEAIKNDVNCIISHHPVLFSPVSKINEKEKIFHLIRNDISVISAHTNLDYAIGGVNDVLAAKLSIKDIHFLSNDNTHTIGRQGEISQPMILPDFARLIKIVLGLKSIKFTDTGRMVKKVAIIGGSGGDDIDKVLECDADTFVTSDLKYKHFLYAKEKNLNLIDAGHYNTEILIVPVMQKWIQDYFNEIEVIISAKNIDIINYI